MLVATRRLFPVFLLGLASVLAVPVLLQALTPAEVMEQAREKQGELKSYTAVVEESGRLMGRDYLNQFQINWVRDGRFSVAALFHVPGEAPVRMRTWFDGTAAYTAVDMGWKERYTKIDFADLPKRADFPAPDYIGRLANPLSLGRISLEELKDYDLSASDGESLMGRRMLVIRAQLKEGIEPRSVSVEGKEFPVQAMAVEVWFGADDGMIYRMVLRSGDEVMCQAELKQLSLSPQGLVAALTPAIPAGAEIFDATEEFRSWVDRSKAGSEGESR